MSRRTALATLLALAACGREPAAPQVKSEPRTSPPATQADGNAVAEAEERAPESGEKPAQVLARYYGLIERGDYDAAWVMRSGKHDETARQRFADNFKAYERYRATVGTASEPVEAGGWIYVEVPVMIYGSFRGGKAFGNSGSVTLRRATSAPGAGPAERAWHIYTG